MNQSEKREVLKLYTYKRLGADDMVARSLCTLISSARTERSIIALRKQADALEVTTHPDYLDLMAQMGAGVRDGKGGGMNSELPAPVRGLHFTHASWLDKDNRPLSCRVTAVRRGTVYWRAIGGGAPYCFPVEDWPKRCAAVEVRA